jgi:tetratricopeptide (TPR) repeat protein
MVESENLIGNGDSFFQKEKYIDAIREYTKALELIGKNEDAETADLCYRLSQAYSSLSSREDENSIKYARMALDIHRKLGEKDMEIMDLLNIGYIEMDSSKLKETENAFSEAIKISADIKDLFLLSTAKNAMAELKEEMKDTSGAQKLYSEVAETSLSSEDWENYFEATRGLIGLMRKKDEDEALKMALQSIDMIDKIAVHIKNKKERKDFRKSLVFMYDLASDIAMELNDVDQAIKIAQRLKAD